MNNYEQGELMNDYRLEMLAWCQIGQMDADHAQATLGIHTGSVVREARTANANAYVAAGVALATANARAAANGTDDTAEQDAAVLEMEKAAERLAVDMVLTD